MKLKSLIIFAASVAVFSSVQVVASEAGNVVAKAGQFVVTQEDVTRYVTLRVPEERRNVYLSSPENIRQAAQNIMMIRMMAERAKQAGMSVDEAQLEWEKQYSASSGLAEKYQNAEVAKAKAEVDWDAYAKEVYLAESDRYVGKAKVDAAHILIKVNEERSPETARALILSLKEKAEAGEDFNDLAREFSEDPSVSHNAGELGAFSKDKMVKEFADAAFQLQAGELSDPVQTRFGYHLIKVNKRIEPQKQEFEALKPTIVQGLNSRITAQTRERLQVDLRSNMAFELNDEAVKQINDEHNLLSGE